MSVVQSFSRRRAEARALSRFMASTAALKLPTEVPVRTSASSGVNSVAGLSPAYRALMMTASYAPYAPPPESTSAVFRCDRDVCMEGCYQAGNEAPVSVDSYVAG